LVFVELEKPERKKIKKRRQINISLIITEFFIIIPPEYFKE